MQSAAEAQRIPISASPLMDIRLVYPLQALLDRYFDSLRQRMRENTIRETAPVRTIINAR